MANANRKTAPSNGANIWMKVMLVVVSLILVASIVFIFIQSTGVVKRSTKAFKSDNYAYSTTMMQYVFMKQYETYYTYASALGINVRTSLKSQKVNNNNSYVKYLIGSFDGTWFEFFWKRASDNAKQTLALLEAAKVAGVTLNEEEKQEIKDAIKELDKAASKAGYPSTSSYLSTAYGDGVKKSDIRTVLEYSALASKFYNQQDESIKNAITDADVDSYYNNHKSDYFKADYLKITFDAKLTKKGDQASEEEKKQYEADVAKAKENAEKLAACKTEEEFRTFMINFWFEDQYDSTYTSTIEKLKGGDKPTLKDSDIPDKEELAKRKEAIRKLILDAVLNDKTTDDFEKSGNTAFDGAIDAIRNAVFTSVKKSYDGILQKRASYSDSKDEMIWVFDEARKVGDTKIFNSDEKKDDKKDENKPEEKAATTTTTTAETFTSQVFYIVKPRYTETTKSVEFGHILRKFATSGTDAEKKKANEEAKAKAEALMKEFLAGEKTKEAFEALAKKDNNNQDSKAFYSDVCPGDMVKAVENWLFDENRKVGDVEVVESTYGYHVMYYVAQGAEAWRVHCKEDLYKDNLKKWSDGVVAKYTVTVNDKVVNQLDF